MGHRIDYRYFSESTLIAMNRKNSLSNIFDDDANLNYQLFNTYTRYKATLFNDIQPTTLSYKSTELLKIVILEMYIPLMLGYKYSKWWKDMQYEETKYF